MFFREMVNPSQPDSRSRFETAFAALLLGLILLAQISVGRLWDGFTNAYWYDELITVNVAEDPDFGRAFSKTIGLDFAPPAAHLMFRLIGTLTGGLTEFKTRFFSILCLWVATIGMFRLLRHSFSWYSSMAGALAVIAIPVVGGHAFEARFYMPWLAAFIWFAVALTAHRRERTNWTAAGLAICAVLLCSVHIFGIMAMLCLVLGDWVFYRISDNWRSRLPVIAGFIALAASVPILILQFDLLWRYKNPSYLPDPSLSNYKRMWPLFAVVLVTLPILVSYARESWRNRSRPESGLIGLVLFPLGLVLISEFGASVLAGRYLMPFFCLGCLLTADVVARVPRTIAVAALVVLAGVGAYSLTLGVKRARTRATDLQTVIQSIQRIPKDQHIFFDAALDWAAVSRYLPEERHRFALIEHDRPGQDSWWTFERDELHQLEATWPHSPRSERWSTLKSRDRLYIVQYDDGDRVGIPATSVGGRLVEVRP